MSQMKPDYFGPAVAAAKINTAYRTAINEIDDYFEYQCDSKKDQKEVHKILARLTKKIKKANKG